MIQKNTSELPYLKLRKKVQNRTRCIQSNIQQKKWVDEKIKIPTNKLTLPQI